MTLRIPIRQHKTFYSFFDDLQEFQLDNYFDNRVLGRAYEYMDKIVSADRSESEIIAGVIGFKPYVVKMKINKDNLECVCTCPMTDPCKHIAAVMLTEMNIDTR